MSEAVQRDPSERRPRREGGFGGGGFGGGSRGGFGGDRGGFGGGRREMFEVVCAECGKDTQVPFQPSGNRPVYCSDCFSRQSGGRGGFGGGGGRGRNY